VDEWLVSYAKRLKKENTRCQRLYREAMMGREEGDKERARLTEQVKRRRRREEEREGGED